MERDGEDRDLPGTALSYRAYPQALTVTRDQDEWLSVSVEEGEQLKALLTDWLGA